MNESSTFLHERLCYIVHMTTPTRPSDQIRRAVQDALAAAGVGARRFESAHGLRPWALRGILDPARRQAPSVDRAAEICAALGLALSIGPSGDSRALGESGDPPASGELTAPRPSGEIAAPRPSGEIAAPRPSGATLREPSATPPALSLGGLERAVRELVRLVAEAGGDPLPASLRSPPQVGFANPDARPVAAANEDDVPAGARSVGTREVEVAAGVGAVNLDEAPVKGPVWFRRDWLDGHGIDPTRCVVISVRGESMEPTLPAGAKILVDRERTRRRAGRLFVIDTGEGLVVKRLGRKGRHWLLLSDHPSWEPVPWPREAEMVGEVRWASRTFE